MNAVWKQWPSHQARVLKTRFISQPTFSAPQLPNFYQTQITYTHLTFPSSTIPSPFQVKPDSWAKFSTPTSEVPNRPVSLCLCYLAGLSPWSSCRRSRWAGSARPARSARSARRCCGGGSSAPCGPRGCRTACSSSPPGPWPAACHWDPLPPRLQHSLQGHRNTNKPTPQLAVVLHLANF